jgi:hypothetical protein
MANKSPRSKPGKPNLFQIFNIFATLKLTHLLITDKRISIFRRGFFGIAVVVLLIIVILPTDIGLFNIIGLPADWVLDWTVATAVIGALLSIFPDEVVREHNAKVHKGIPNIPPQPSSRPKIVDADPSSQSK